MSGTLQFHRLLTASARLAASRSGAHCRQGLPFSVLRPDFLPRGGRRCLAVQAAPAAGDTAQPAGPRGDPYNSRRRRDLQSSFGSVSAAGYGDRRQTGAAAQTGSDLDRALAKMDVDAKRAGRVGLLDFTGIMKQIGELPKIPSQAALLLVRCCGSLLSELKPADRVKLAEDLWSTLEKSCERLDVSHYNALLKVHLENTHKFDPTVFLSSMEQKGVQPNRVTYQRMAAYYCQQGDIDGATKILEFMRAKDLPINESVFNVLIQGYARSGDMDSARGVLDMMRSSQVEPSADTYRTLIEAFAEKKDMANVRKCLTEAENGGILLSDADLFGVVQAMASQGDVEHAGEILARLRKAPGFFHDAINACLRLLDHGQSDVAYRIMAGLNLPREINERSGFGIIFLRKLLRYNEPVEKIWHYVEDMRDKQLNPWAVDRCVESALLIGRMDYATELIQKMGRSGMVVRGHYFWPIIAAYAKAGNIKGVFESIGIMTELGVNISLETLTDYVLPALKSLSTEEIVDQFRTRYPSVSIMTPLAVYNLDNGKIREAMKLIEGQEILTNPSVIVAPLANAFLQTKDFPATELFLKLLHRQTAQQSNPYDSTGQFLLNVVTGTKGDEKELTEVLTQLARAGLRISHAVTGSIENRFRGRLPGHIGALLDKLTSADGSLQLDVDEFGKHPRSMNVEELESHLQELKGKNMNTRGVLRRLLLEHARLRNPDRVHEIKAELDAGRFEYSGGMYAQLMDMYTALGDLDKALEVRTAAQTVDRNFVTDPYKVLNLAGLMVTKDRLDDALSLLDEYVKKNDRPIDFETIERNVFRLLNVAAEKGDLATLDKLWDRVSAFGKFVPTNLICGPLVKVHVVKDDIPAAVKAFMEAVEKYKHTPWKGELMRRLVEAEDTTSLQQVMDASIRVHGETNSLYDLAFAFIEAGRVKQAQKIFDTPGMRARQDRLDKFAERVIERSNVAQMEGLLAATRDVFDVDRDALYHHLIRLFGKLGDPDKALAAWTNMQEENLLASPKTLRALASVLREHKREIPFSVPEDIQSHSETASPEETRLLNSIREDNPDQALDLKRDMDAKEQPLSIKGYSYLIELLLQKERVKEAVSLTRELAERGHHPFPAVSKFLISKLSRAGDVSTLEELQSGFTEKFSAFLGLNKAIFSAYVNANRSEEILSRHEKNPELGVPVAGLLHLLRATPSLFSRVEKLVESAMAGGDTRPAVALWTYLFSQRKFDESRKLLERHPAVSGRLRALSICEKAHENNDFEMLLKLIDTLREHSRPNVALAYSYLVGLHCHNRDYNAGLQVVKEAQDVAGLALHELRLSALRVLEKGLLQMGQPVPFKIPELERHQQQQGQQDFSSEVDEDSTGGRQARR